MTRYRPLPILTRTRIRPIAIAAVAACVACDGPLFARPTPTPPPASTSTPRSANPPLPPQSAVPLSTKAQRLAESQEVDLPRVVRVTHHRLSGVYTLDFSNDVRAHIRPMPGASSASITIRVLAGELNESPANRGLTNAVASSLRTLEPPGPNSPRMLITSGPEGMTIRCTFAPEQLEHALARVCSVLREPNIDAEAFQRAKVSTLNRARQTDLGVGLGPVFSAMRLSSDPRLAPPSPESVDAWTLDAVRDWAKHILRIGPIELAIAGNIQLADAQSQLRANLAGLKSASLISPNTWADLRLAPRDMPAGVVRVASATAAGNIHLVLPGPDAGDLAAVRSASVVAALLKPRLSASLTKPGGKPPTLGISLVPSRAFRGLGMMMVTARQAEPPDAARVELAGPGVIDPAVAPLFDAINSAIADAQSGQFPSDAQLADAIATATRESRTQLQDPEYWSRVLSISTFQGLDADDLARALEDYQAITLTRVREAIIAIGDPAKGRCAVIVPPASAAPPP